MLSTQNGIRHEKPASRKPIRRSMASKIPFACIQVSAGAYGSPQLRVHSLDLRRTTVNEKFDAVDEA